MLFCASIIGGLFGSLLGLGGGVILVPIYTLLFKMNLIEAVALSLCAIMATSVTASTKYLASGLVDLKVVFDLEITTIIGAFGGGLLAVVVGVKAAMLLFAGVMIYSAVAILISSRNDNDAAGSYSPGRYATTIGLSGIAGIFVGLLGIGGGIVKVPLLHLGLRKPIKAAVATSTLMVGITACTALLPYFHRGDVRMEYVPFATLGTMTGALFGSRVLHRIKSLYLKLFFSALLLYTAVQMILNGVG